MKNLFFTILFSALFFSNLNAQSCDTCIPLISFTTTPSSCSAVVKWTTGVEQANESFSIERSNDGSNFIEIASVAPKYTITGGAYSYIDNSPYNKGGLFYRLRIIYQDSTYFDSPISYLNISCNNTTPFPASLCNGTPIISAPDNLLICNGTSQLNIQNITLQTISWTSSNTAVATVSASGLLTPISTGKVIITANLPVCAKTVTKSITVCKCLSAPTGLAFTYCSNASGYNLTWDPISGANFNLKVTDITANANNSSAISPWITSSNGVALVNVGTSNLCVTILKGHTYKATIFASNNCTNGPSTNYVFTVTPPVLAAPTELKFTYIANSLGNNLTWDAIQGANYDINIIDITPGFNNSAPAFTNINTNGVALVGVGTSLFSVTILAGHTYQATIIADNGCITSASTIYDFTITPPPCILTIDPTTFIASSLCYSGCGYEKFSWMPVSNAVAYQINYVIYNSAGIIVTQGTVNSTLATYTASYGYQLNPSGEVIRFKINAQCSNGGWSGFSTWSSQFPL